MATRHPNHRLVKINRSYTVDEIASLFKAHRNTVRNWLRHGLAAIDDRRPILVHGGVLIDFLTTRRKKNKRPCAPGQIYCFGCRDPRIPDGNKVVYQALTSDRGNLIGVCPDCGTRLFRRVSQTKLAASLGDLKLRFTEAEEHIDESPTPSVNCDLNQDASNHD